MPAPDYFLEQEKAIRAIAKILESRHPDATYAEKLVRIGWVIGSLPAPARDAIVGEAQNRVTIGWAAGLDPTEFGP